MVSSIGSRSVSSWANSLFGRIDTKNQGYIEKADLQAAFSKIDATAKSGTISEDGATSTDIDAVFKQLDGDSDGKVTKDEMSSALEKLAGELNAQFDQSRVRGGMKGGGMQPPPPQGGAGPDQVSSSAETAGTDASYVAAADTDGDGTVSAEELADYQASGATSSASSASALDEQGSMIAAFGGMAPPPQMHGARDAGFSRDELLNQLDELGASDSRRSSLNFSLVENFDEADSDGHRMIDHMGARGPDRSLQDREVSSADGNAMMKMMQLLRAYGLGGDSAQSGTSTLSVTA